MIRARFADENRDVHDVSGCAPSSRCLVQAFTTGLAVPSAAFVLAHTRKRWQRVHPDIAPAADRLQRVLSAERPDVGLRRMGGERFAL